MKKILYIGMSTLLGIFISLLVHAGLEVIALKTITPKITWQMWSMLHMVGSLLLFILGALGGARLGMYWIKNYKYWSLLSFKSKS